MHQDIGSYHRELHHLFWSGFEPYTASTRAANFLTHLPLNGYSEVYKVVRNNPPDPRWNFGEIAKEVREYGATMKLIMLHVSLWYDPELTEPAPRQRIKDPIYYHLKVPLCKTVFRGWVTDTEWQKKAIALQKIVLDFSKKNWLLTKGPFMTSTLKFYVMPEKSQYHERFVPGTFWDLLAKEIRKKMPDMPFQHPDLQTYVIHGESPFTAKALGKPKGTGAGSSAGDEQLVAGEVSAEVFGLIRNEYGASTGDDLGMAEEGLDVTGLNGSTSQAFQRPQSPTSSTENSVSGLRGPMDHDPYDDDSESSTVRNRRRSGRAFPARSSLGKRKATAIKPDPENEDDDALIALSSAPYQRLWDSDDLNHRPSKIVKLKIAQDTIVVQRRPVQPAANDQVLGSPKTNGVHRQRSHTPPSAIQEPSPSTSVCSTGVVPSESDDAPEIRSQRARLDSDGSEPQPTQPKVLNDPLPRPRRRQMTTNLPAGTFTPTPASTQPINHDATSSQPLGVSYPPSNHSSAMQRPRPVHIAPAPQRFHSTPAPNFVPQRPEMPSSLDPYPAPPMLSTYDSGYAQQLPRSQPAQPQYPHARQNSYISPFAPTAYMSPLPQDTPSLSQLSPAPTPPSTHSQAQPQPQPQPQLTRIEQSIQILEQNYGDRLTLGEQVKALNALQDERKAAIFCVVRREELRRAWLWNEIGKVE